MKSIIVDGLIKKYEGDIAESKATVLIYLMNPVGIGVHPQHLQEIDKLISKISDAEHKLEIIKKI